MKKILFACAVAASVAFAEESEGTSGENGSAAMPAAEAKKPAVKTAFTTLPLCRLVEGTVEVCLPGGSWSAAEEGHFYPLGASYRAGKDGRLVLAFGAEATAEIGEDAEFSTRVQTLGQMTRTLVLVRGTVDLKLPDSLPEGAFVVAAPGFSVKNPAGESRFVYEDKGDGDRVTVRCVTGSLGVEGCHFDIPVMRSANEVVIRTSHDHLSTFLYGTSGDYVVRLDQGVRVKDEIGDDGQVKRVEEKATADWHLSPATKVIINRLAPAIGERLSVHTMAFDAAGERKSECVFCEGRAEVNSGELVVSEKKDGEDLAKRAAEATETTAADVEESGSEESSSGDGNSDSNEE